MTEDAHTIDETEDSIADPYVYDHTCGASTSLLIVGACWRSNQDASLWTVTYDGDAMTFEVQAGANNGQSAWWYLLAPNTGSALQVSLNHDGTVTWFTTVAISLIGSKTTVSPIGDTATSTDDDPDYDIVTTADGSWSFDLIGARGNNVTLSHGSESGRLDYSPTAYKIEYVGNEGASGGTKYEDITSASTTVTYTWTTTNEAIGQVGSCAIEVLAAPVGALIVPPLLHSFARNRAASY